MLLDELDRLPDMYEVAASQKLYGGDWTVDIIVELEERRHLIRSTPEFDHHHCFNPSILYVRCLSFMRLAVNNLSTTASCINVVNAC
jgi:hypothetical protein